MKSSKKLLKKDSGLSKLIGEKEKLKEKELKKEFKNFSFADFARTVVGTLVFAGSVFFTLCPWEFIPTLPIKKVIIVHILYILCILFILNYAYRHTFDFDAVFLSGLLKRTFYTYVTVLGVVLLLLWTFNKLTPDLITLDLLRLVFVSHALGMAGAIAFQFIAD